MIPVNQNGSSATPGPGALIITPTPGNGGITTFLPWIATARDNSLSQGSGNSGTVFEPAVRTSTSCYMRGLKEDVEIQTSSQLPWQWRRVCFTYKDTAEALGTTLGGISGLYENSNGFGRLIYNVTSGSTPDALALNSLRTLMFRGRLNVDWVDYFTAPLDTTRISVRFDRTKTIASGNGMGVIRKYPMWHPMNKTLVYDDAESGQNTTPSYYSVGGKPGMGDYYVVDMFQPGQGSTSTDKLLFEAQATLYWHEK